MAQALFIAGSAVLIAVQAVDRIRQPEPVGAPWLSIGVIVLLNGSILLALVFASLGFAQVDAWFGLGISAYILWSAIQIGRALWSAIQIGRESFAVLMDEELSPEISQHMLELAKSIPGVLGAHDLRTRVSGNHWFVQLHLELPGELTLSVAHGLSDQADQAAEAIHAVYPKAEVLVHADPREVVKHRD